MGDIVIDATGDLDVAASAGAAFCKDSYMVTTVFRLGGVDTDEAERFQFEEPERYAALDLEARRVIGGSWDYWWLKTPLPGIVWCNCPHMTGLDGMKVEDLTRAEFEGRRRIHAMVDHVRAKLPGFANCYVVDVAPQTGVRQTRMLDGEYVVTKSDVTERVHFPDSIARGRDYYTPYRALLPRGIDQLLVAGRHYSATPQAQKISREIPPCMAMGEAAGIAAAMALSGGTHRAQHRCDGTAAQVARARRRSRRPAGRQRAPYGACGMNAMDRTQNSPPPLEGGGWGEGSAPPGSGPARTPPPNPLPKGRGRRRPAPSLCPACVLSTSPRS